MATLRLDNLVHVSKLCEKTQVKILIDNRFWNTTVGKVANTVMQLWMKSDTENSWSLYQVNNLPTVINGWNIVMILAANVYVDATGRRMVVVVANLVSPQIYS